MSEESLRAPAPRIRELSALVRDQIAAGEVVERPASVVKELVENALDAGASEVRIDLEEGGARLVRIVDDGIGMGPEDLRLAFCSHATSKLRGVEDLEHIASLGFRGEALASIGSVSRARIVSRPGDSETGWQIEDEGGKISNVLEAGGARGTTVEIRDLFYNTPARRRFLKRTSTELGRCLDILQRLALAHTGTGFVITHDKKRVFDVGREMDFLSRIRRTFGAELADSLVPVSGEDRELTLSGFVAPPRFARRDTSRQMWFLNGRPLRDRILIRVLKEAYRGFLMEGRQPVAFLSLGIDPGAVDVNVHPTKSEVRFREQRRIFGFLLEHLRRAVGTMDVATPGERLLDSSARRGNWIPPAGQASAQPGLPDPGPLARRRGDDEALRVYQVPGPAFEEARGEQVAEPDAGAGDAWERRARPDEPYLTIDDTYLVRVLPDGFEIIDQHALHERVSFEGFKAQLRDGTIEVQHNLMPELVELSRAEVKTLEPHLGALGELGVMLSVFGDTTVAVQGIPAMLRRTDAPGLVRDLCAHIERTGRAPDGEALLEDVLHSRACRSSVMAGDRLDATEVEALLRRAGELEHDQTCPHGRPTRVKFTLADLEKAFHRK